jgi:hypothetical protein
VTQAVHSRLQGRVTSRRPWTLVAALALVAGCFPVDPVRERLQITFDESGFVSVELHVNLAAGEKKGAVGERLDAVRQSYLRQTDPWTARFERAGAKHERECAERESGRLVAVERAMLIPPDRLSEVFYDTGIQVFYGELDGVAELALYAGASQRATREQLRDYRALVEGWGSDFARYLREMSSVYAYMDANPQRAAPLFADLLGESKEDGEEDELTDEEREILGSAHAAMDAVITLFETSESRAYSLNELASLVNDPFPADVSVRPGGKLLESSGFEVDGEAGMLRVPRVSLWSAVDALRGHWLSPDPLAAVVENARDDSVPLPSSETMAGLPRFAAPPRDGAAVWNEVSKRLETTRTFRASWTVARPRRPGA